MVLVCARVVMLTLPLVLSRAAFTVALTVGLLVASRHLLTAALVVAGTISGSRFSGQKGWRMQIIISLKTTAISPVMECTALCH